jgi:hypothetical protein
MIKPIIYDELFEINDNLVPSFSDGVLVIDNFYKNYDEIHEILNNMYVPIWKSSEISRNFKDYYDCRLILQNNTKIEKFKILINSICQLIEYYYNQKVKSINGMDYIFNYYNCIKKDVSNNYQHYPHVDRSFNLIVYLDKISSGGTAFYPNLKNFENKEHDNLLFDVSEFEKKIVQSKPNRMVLFKGDVYHGGYVENHDFYRNNNWRINQVIFFDVD